MGYPLLMPPQKIGILSEQDTLRCLSIFEVILVGRTEQSCIRSCGDVDAASPQRLSDGMIDVLIKMKLYRRSVPL